MQENTIRPVPLPERARVALATFPVPQIQQESITALQEYIDAVLPRLLSGRNSSAIGAEMEIGQAITGSEMNWQQAVNIFQLRGETPQGLPTVEEQRLITQAKVSMILQMVAEGTLPENTGIFEERWVGDIVDMQSRLGEYESVDRLIALRRKEYQMPLLVRAAVVTIDKEKRHEFLQRALHTLNEMPIQYHNIYYLNMSHITNFLGLLYIHDIPFPPEAQKWISRLFDKVADNLNVGYPESSDYLIAALENVQHLPQAFSNIQEVAATMFDRERERARDKKRYIPENTTVVETVLPIAELLIGQEDWGAIKKRIDTEMAALGTYADEGYVDSALGFLTIIGQLLVRYGREFPQSPEIQQEIFSYADVILRSNANLGHYGVTMHQPIYGTMKALWDLPSEIQQAQQQPTYMQITAALASKVLFGREYIEMTEPIGHSTIFTGVDVLPLATLQKLRDTIGDTQIKQLKVQIQALKPHTSPILAFV